ncbi:MAG TPA: MBL fold metallo-hydrolase [Candidatus Limnocylindrales bacterium]
MDPALRLTYLGHSTVLIEVSGSRILTDPVLIDRRVPLRRVAEPLRPEQFAGIDLVLLSHLHLDHFDVPSLRLLEPGPHFVVPRGAGALLGRLGFRMVSELEAGEAMSFGPVAVTATKAMHGGFRPPAGPRAAALGYLIESERTRIYFAGDTDLFDGMAGFGAVDVALLPVWGWGPNLGRGHLDPERAAQALELIHPSFAIPIHWGTLWPRGFGRVRAGRLTDPPHEFSALAARTRPDTRILVTAPGTTVSFARQHATGGLAPI